MRGPSRAASAPLCLPLTGPRPPDGVNQPRHDSHARMPGGSQPGRLPFSARRGEANGMDVSRVACSLPAGR